MAIYAMGDLHGCYREFKKLLEKIEFDHAKDRLYLVGDLINRGPKSEKTLNYLMKHTDSIFPVLGNHDLAFLVYAQGLIRLKRHDTYDQLMQSPDVDAYIHFLRQQPLMHYIEDLDVAICHAGIHPSWSIDQALELAKEAETVLKDDELCGEFVPQMFGNQPNYWDESLTGIDRIRAIVNVFTRMRYLFADGHLDFDAKVPLSEATETLIPWFKMPNAFGGTEVIFGHWASLGLHSENNITCIDTGCAWGEKLTAIRLDQSPHPLFHKKRKD
ncbi:symmetrical bis(5'-nucleosyl)-tetraphosphatase [Wohlfahrtiimonas chitiniclastica]|uniref:symmetrical bis(5'-nucleosyl)-tetraphosphatase n=1 Tax=Wohlfahrtiimonas chitiniclastica TaxID=400946 RepID=UPI001BD17CC1|nr:symmetrical bis(5'-nucleosyl)-tetraphosphatase [Wohlfahrtiimonas chitiniclastica]MBS7818907.1 symmetrical bis(5'-nucleosyl)-tetraphosphatase [Wohlfahrtiimonas chitiniclastica]MBS7826559.1 symmetrical bis(5'-nucleosyl)-tetraphosphatase [Wohlfahrtiimonas chitiniclastica]